MGHQVKEPGIALQVCSQITGLIYDFLKIVDTCAVIPAAKIQSSYFIIQYHDAMLIKEQSIFTELLFNMRNCFQAFLKRAQHKVLVDLCSADINKSLNAKVVMLFYPAGLSKRFKFFKRDRKLPVITQIKMCIQQVMNSLNVMAGFHPDHQWLRIEHVNPFLRIPVILQKILADKCIPAITLVQV